MRIVRLANLCSLRSTRVKVGVEHLGAGYRAAGHETVLVLPGREHAVATRGGTTVINVRSPLVPRSGGCRIITDVRRVAGVLDELRPDRIEVSGKGTLVLLTTWARDRRVPSVLLSHERLDTALAARLPPVLLPRRALDRWNHMLVSRFDSVVVASQFGAQEFLRIGADNLSLVPLGVDLDVFRPRPDRAARTPRWRLTYVGGLFAEKRPELAVEAVRLLRAAGTDVGLSVIGAGAMERALRERAHGLPIDFIGFVADRSMVAGELARADIAIVPSPMEPFGLAALEAMACGTPVVVADAGGTAELLAPDAGVAAPATAAGMARAIRAVMSTPRAQREAAARARAEEFPWGIAAARMLQVHQDARVRS